MTIRDGGRYLGGEGGEKPDPKDKPTKPAPGAEVDAEAERVGGEKPAGDPRPAAEPEPAGGESGGDAAASAKPKGKA